MTSNQHVEMQHMETKHLTTKHWSAPKKGTPEKNITFKVIIKRYYKKTILRSEKGNEVS